MKEITVYKTKINDSELYAISHAICFRESRCRGFFNDVKSVNKKFTDKQITALNKFHVIILEDK